MKKKLTTEKKWKKIKEREEYLLRKWGAIRDKPLHQSYYVGLMGWVSPAPDTLYR